jgi:hypothetical protein
MKQPTVTQIPRHTLSIMYDLGVSVLSLELSLNLSSLHTKIACPHKTTPHLKSKHPPQQHCINELYTSKVFSLSDCSFPFRPFFPTGFLGWRVLMHPFCSFHITPFIFCSLSLFLSFYFTFLSSVPRSRCHLLILGPPRQAPPPPLDILSCHVSEAPSGHPPSSLSFCLSRAPVPL